MSKLKNCGRFIPFDNASAYAKKFKEHHKKLLKEEYHEQFVFPHSETFSKEIILQLLKRKKCEGLRIYLGQDDENMVRMILLGVDENGNDILPVNNKPSSTMKTAAKFAASTKMLTHIAEDGQRCPPSCPPPKNLYQQ